MVENKSSDIFNVDKSNDSLTVKSIVNVIKELLTEKSYVVLDISDLNLCLIGNDNNHKIIFSKKEIGFDGENNKCSIFKKHIEKKGDKIIHHN